MTNGQKGRHHGKRRQTKTKCLHTEPNQTMTKNATVLKEWQPTQIATDMSIWVCKFVRSMEHHNQWMTQMQKPGQGAAANLGEKVKAFRGKSGSRKFRLKTHSRSEVGLTAKRGTYINHHNSAVTLCVQSAKVLLHLSKFFWSVAQNGWCSNSLLSTSSFLHLLQSALWRWTSEKRISGVRSKSPRLARTGNTFTALLEPFKKHQSWVATFTKPASLEMGSHGRGMGEWIRRHLNSAPFGLARGLFGSRRSDTHRPVTPNFKRPPSKILEPFWHFLTIPSGSIRKHKSARIEMTRTRVCLEALLKTRRSTWSSIYRIKLRSMWNAELPKSRK